LPIKSERTECSETSAYKIQTPRGNYPEENIQHSEHGESLKSRIVKSCFVLASILFVYMLFPKKRSCKEENFLRYSNKIFLELQIFVKSNFLKTFGLSIKNKKQNIKISNGKILPLIYWKF
jgi:hypothetical protein